MLIHFSRGGSASMRTFAFSDGSDRSAAVYNLDVTLQVHSTANPNTAMPLMTVFFKGLTLTYGTGAGQASVSCIYGGINQGLTYAYGENAPLPGAGDPSGMGMSWTIGLVPTSIAGGGTTISFYNTPLRAPEIPNKPTSDKGGLPVTCQLYESEYISCPVSNCTAAASLYTPDLTSTSLGPKNTARW